MFWFRELLINKLQFNNQTHYKLTPSYKRDPKNLQRCSDSVVCEERFVSRVYGAIFCRFSAFNVNMWTENVGIVQTVQWVKEGISRYLMWKYTNLLWRHTISLSVLNLFVFILNRKNKTTMRQMRRNSPPARRGSKEIHYYFTIVLTASLFQWSVSSATLLIFSSLWFLSGLSCRPENKTFIDFELLKKIEKKKYKSQFVGD